MTTVRNLVDAAPMSRLQIGVFVLAGIVNMAEGYDILSMALANVGATAEWHLSGAQSGMLLSASIIGMALGAAGLSPIGDKLGRKPLLILALSLIVVGMALSAMATGFLMLFIVRLISGIGMGAYIPSLPIIVGEFAPIHRRAAMIGFYGLGIPLGGVIFGGAASAAISLYGWRSAFVLGAALTFLMLVLVLIFMPESPEHLESRGGAAEAKLHRLLHRMRLDPRELGQPLAPAVQDMPRNAAKNPLSVLNDAAGYRLASICLAVSCITWVLVNGVYTFANTWTPRLLVTAGLSESGGINSTIILTGGGALGTLVFAFLALRFSAIRIASIALVCGAAAFVLFGITAAKLSTAMVSAFVLGFCLSMVFTALYAILPGLFVPSARVRALGIAASVGRLGGIAAPLAIGLLLDMGWHAALIFQVMAIPSLIGVVLLIYTGAIHRRRVRRIAGELAENSTPSQLAAADRAAESARLSPETEPNV